MAGVSTKPLTLSATLPSTIPMSTAADVHARKAGRCRRSDSPHVEEMRPSAGPGRSASSPAPRSRPRRSRNAIDTRITVATSGRTRIPQRVPEKARTCWLHPIGDSQDSHPGPPSARSPTARATYATARAISPMPVAARALTLSCAVIPPTAANSSPVAPHAAPNAMLPSAGSPAIASPAAVRTAIAAAAIAASSIPAARGAARPTTVDPTSSRRPVSSSARVWRTTRMIIRTPIMAAPKAVILNSDSSPRDMGS